MKASLAKMRARGEALMLKVAGNKRGLKVAQNRWRANHKRAVANYRAAKKNQRLAKAHEHWPDRARKEEAAAQRQGVRAQKAHDRAEYWVGRAKEANLKLNHLTETRAELETKIDKATKAAGPVVHFEENKVTGGTDKQRVGVAMHVSMARAREYYSQSGQWTIKFCLTGPPNGCRYDCSSWFTSVYWTCDLPDPNGQNFKAGWTGTLGEHGRQIPEAQADTGDAILYGYAPFFHIEAKDGPMSKSPYTVGHGSSAVDRGTVGMLPGPRQVRRYL